jgi:hypothetical protein
MTMTSQIVDSVRASRDGHEIHEAWVARRAMQLLIPNDDLLGIAVEGLAPADQAVASSETVEIADIVLYYGRNATFNDAHTVNIVQFKYSISRSLDEFRATDAKKTIAKFGAAFLDYRENYGARKVRDKLSFELITNRPIYLPFEQAIKGIAEGKSLFGTVKQQVEQFKTASGLDGQLLVEFASKCLMTGLAGNLTDTKRDLSRTLIDWSATSDAVAGARLGAMRQMVRDKAGHDGMHKNVIRRTDVLAALDVPDIDALLPCPASLSEVGEVVAREQLAEAMALVPQLDRPLLVHAAGGVGKTVFMDSLAKSLQNKHEVVFFDCFGGGAYRAPDDARHHPKRGLVHIVNTLATRGLCDPLLPGNDNVESLFKTFRRRLTQCVQTLATASAERQLLLFFDAIDNAAEHARDRHEESFPTLLLESFQLSGPVRGVKLVVSCRSHRIGIVVKDIPYRDFALRPFSRTETESYLRARRQQITATEIKVAQARSGGNARILEHLVNGDRGLLDPSEIEKTIVLDDLLQARIDKALSDALNRGYKAEDTSAFLAGLGVLPPPVPIDEYAGALGIAPSAIESFAADLSPLLERTNHGLMFRDEPTETLIREKYASSDDLLRGVATNLLARQDSSVYAARALPSLLQKLNDGEQLFKLAFDQRFPASITSTVGKRNIRYVRLKAAVLHAANHQDYNRLIHLLVELSTITAVDQRGRDYILAYPDLVIAAHDVDATRRLFETRTKWQGTRHARLAIANTLSSDFDEAYRHAIGADEWIYHHMQKEREYDVDQGGPNRHDIAAIPFFLISQRRSKHAISFLRRWKEWYVYEIGEHIFALLQQLRIALPSLGRNLDAFLDGLTDEIGCIASAISFLELDDTRRRELLAKLSKIDKKAKKLEFNNYLYHERTYDERSYDLAQGLRKASAIAVSLGLNVEALAISRYVPHERPRIWSFRDHGSVSNVWPFIFHIALVSAVQGKEIYEKDILPKELIPIASNIKNALTGAEFKKKLKERLEKCAQTNRDESDANKKGISYEEKSEAERFIDHGLEPLLELTKAFASLLSAPAREGDKAFVALLETWAQARRAREGYGTEKFNRFFQILGCQMAVFALWARSDVQTSSVKLFIKCLHEQEILGTSRLIEIVAVLAKRAPLQGLAGEEAMQAKLLIDTENDVTSKASYYADLARAILPASRDEAAAYFKAGLEQLDAIGSGDYQFTNELLLFAASLKGNELDERDFHTLTNICELNMPEEAEKFPWFAFAKGLSRTAGCQALAKLSRWDDRSKIPLKYTLLPYLTALIDDGKIKPEDALALNWLANPVEFYSCGTDTFATAIDNKNYPNSKELITEVIKQFEANNPGAPMDSTVKTLASIAERVLGKTSKISVHLSAAYQHFEKVREERNEHINYHGRSDMRWSGRSMSRDRLNRTKLKKTSHRVIPTDEVSLGKLIDELNNMQSLSDLNFDELRSKLPFSHRLRYIQVLAGLENLDLYTKLTELKRCKEAWGYSSAALVNTYKTLGVPLLQLHADELVSYGQLSGYQLKEIADITKVPIVTLALELTKLFATPDSSVPASVWLALAGFICKQADDGEGQAALKRLLNSEAANLSSNVIDGIWKEGLYPVNDAPTIASGLVWRMLGSPNAADRWHAAHSVRCFARFGRWEVIDALVAKYGTKDAHPFQAPELTFYFMHARLWLLIALARIALDDPQAITRYQNTLMQIVQDDDEPHVLMRHFASRAILACVDNGSLKLPTKMESQIRQIDLSPFPRLRQKVKQPDGFYHRRPSTAPKPTSEFYLDYDFEKYDVHNLSDVFGKPSWVVKDLISEVVRGFDPNITRMYESGGRHQNDRNRSYRMTSSYHTYGQQLGWHALFLVAGRLLKECPVTDDWFYDDPWPEWFNRYLLSRQDGLWLSDGMDTTPLEVTVNLLEKGKDGLVITSDKGKILKLLGLDSGVSENIIVEGSWHSNDGIEVDISSAMVLPRRARTLAKLLIEEEPMSVCLPIYDEYENDQGYVRNKNGDYVPWIVYSSGDAKLDEDDPLGATCAIKRPRLARKIASLFSLQTNDPFARVWENSRGLLLAQSNAWGYENKYNEEGSTSGVRLLCSQRLLKDILNARDADLLLLIKLQRYEKGLGSEDSKFTHTVAVVRVKKTLEVEYYKGRANYLYKFRY